MLYRALASTIPIHMEPTAMEESAGPSAGIRILLVENSDADAYLVSLCLRESDPLDYSLTKAESLEKGISRLPEGYDLVLLELILPDSTPQHTFDLLHRAAPQIPIVVVSGTQDDRLAKRCIERGARAFLAKDSLSPQALGAVVRGATRRSA